MYRNSPPEVFLGKGVVKICSRFTEEHPCQNVISMKLLCNFIEIAFRHGCFPVKLQHFFRIPFPKNTSVGLLQHVWIRTSTYTTICGLNRWWTLASILSIQFCLQCEKPFRQYSLSCLHAPILMLWTFVFWWLCHSGNHLMPGVH